jgi:hypothetical protein
MNDNPFSVNDQAVLFVASNLSGAENFPTA